MKMVLYRHELKRYIRPLIIWTACMAGLFAFGMSMFPSFSQNAKGMNDLLASMPKELLKGFGIAASDFTRSLDYMAYMFQYILLAAGAHAILLGSGIVSREEAEHTIDFLYARPLTRTSIVTSKVLAGVTVMAALNAAFLAITIAVLNIVDPGVDNGKIALIGLAMFCLQLLFFALGLLVSMLAKRSRKFTTAGLGVAFAMYFLGIMSAVSDTLADLKYLSPFKYFEPIDIVRSGALDAGYLLIAAAVIAACVAASYALYGRRDLAG